jgi:hypothetical protein
VDGAMAVMQKEKEARAVNCIGKPLASGSPDSGDLFLSLEAGSSGSVQADADADSDTELFSGHSPIQLLKLGYVHMAGQGRFINSRIAWEYVKHCIDCNNRLIEQPDAEQLLQTDDARFIESEQPSRASVLGLVLWVEKTVRQSQTMIDFLFAGLNMEFAVPGAADSGNGAGGKGKAKGPPDGASGSASGSRDLLTAPMMDILDPYPTRLPPLRLSGRDPTDSDFAMDPQQRPPRPELGGTLSSTGSSHLSLSLDGSLSLAMDSSRNRSRSALRSKSPNPAIRRSVDSPMPAFELSDDPTLGQIMSDEKEVLLQKNMDLVRDRLNYATKVLTATMSVAGLPLDIQEKCAKCLRDVLSNCASLTAQIKARLLMISLRSRAMCVSQLIITFTLSVDYFGPHVWQHCNCLKGADSSPG